MFIFQKKSTILLIFLFLAGNLYAEELPPMPRGPLLLTSVVPGQLSPDFWINRIQDPDRMIKTKAEMDYFNTEIHEMIAERINVFKINNTIAGRPIRDEISENFKVLRNRVFYGIDDARIKKTYFDQALQPRLNTDHIPSSIKVKWAVATQATSVRAMPTDTKMLEDQGDIEFDQLQYTLIKLWTPVAIYHESKGGSWLFVQSPYSRGWVKSSDLAVFSTKAELKKWTSEQSFLAVTGESISVYYDQGLTNLRRKVSMGTRLPLVEKTSQTYAIKMPFRKPDNSVILQTSYIRSNADVSIGYLPYTQRNVLNQAFKLLGARYGWGGMYNGRDCSGFIHDVFLSMGVDMPRNSKEQGFVGTQLGNYTPFLNQEEKVGALRVGKPGMTLLLMRKHIMLYLGEYNGDFYVLHSTWAERTSMKDDTKNRINQVVVSDLSLNGNSYLGSLFDRIISINELN